jgi:hypothetical protein
MFLVSVGLTSIDVSFCGKQLYSVFVRRSSPPSLTCSALSLARRSSGSGSVFIRACGHSVMFVPSSASLK